MSGNVEQTQDVKQVQSSVTGISLHQPKIYCDTICNSTTLKV